MGSIITEPEDIAIFAGYLNGEKNITTICTSLAKISSRGVFNHSDPLSYWVPLLLFQMTLSCGTFLLVTKLFRPLGLPIVVRQMLTGIILGPSVMCRSPFLANTFFPVRGFIMLDIVASFGFILYFFLIGVQTDPWILKYLDRKAAALGFFGVAVPMVSSVSTSFFILSHFDIDKNIARSLPAVAQALSVYSFQVVAYFLAELKIINSEFGRVALSASFVAGACSFTVTTINVLLQQSPGDNFRALQTLFNTIVLLIVIFFVLRPGVMWMVKNNPEGEPLKESYVIWLLLTVLVTGFLSHTLGLHLYLGPLIFGITIPAGRPIGSTLVDKLDILSNWIFMPLYLVKNGLVIDIFSIKLKNYLIVQSIGLISASGKFIGTFVVARFTNIPTKDAAALGLVMNVQGVLELGLFKMLKRNTAIDSETFVIMCISMMLITGAITPVIKRLYDPSRRYAVYRKRTVLNLKPNFELRVVVCIHDNEDAPAAIDLLEALNPTKRSPLYVYILHFIDLAGRVNALLIPHKLSRRTSKKAKHSEHVINAFRSFENKNHGLVMVYPFTAICPTKSMYDDACTMALDRRASLVIIPFHKRFQVNGAIDLSRKNIKMTNMKILEKAPCSTAILVNHGLLNAPKSILNSHSNYRVAVMFLGGPDDREALAIASRMTGHPNISLTIIRLLENGSISSDDTTERKLDNEMVSQIRSATAGNYRVMYIEEVVMDGTGTISVIKSMQDLYDLIIVGKHHDKKSQLLSGLVDWNDLKELGTIGDVFASAQFMVNTTILVVQQHTNIARQSGQTFRQDSGRTDRDDESDHLPIYSRVA
ncbi:cation/H(+) antiporter 15-like [Mercurialis annua]|uniref:cation/H(+) antiporter 15-like n=1 Tax=Mercurialis annua TaxID=3986 RepID=UPI00215FD3F2|nr:cation/H(+) antiporter 15-like [Mercurialis annua]